MEVAVVWDAWKRGGHDIIDLQLRRTFVAHVKVAKVVPPPPSHQGKPLELQAGGC